MRRWGQSGPAEASADFRNEGRGFNVLAVGFNVLSVIGYRFVDADGRVQQK